ncbi:MAG: PH domain-containing protein [Candidatus Moraniibacteriota bacterium]
MPENYTFGRYHFQGQHENEQILQVIHRHWFNITVHLGVMFLLSFFLLGSISFIPFLFPETALENTSFFAFIQSTILLFMWTYGFLTWIDYYFDVWIVTNERIVNIEQRGLFARSISELRFSRVQDVTASASGLVSTILNFGDVSVQTAAEEERFVFRQVSDPFAVKDRIMTLSRQSAKDDMRDITTALGK